MTRARVASAIAAAFVVVCVLQARPAAATPRPVATPRTAATPAVPDPIPAIGDAVGGLAGGLARDSANTALDAVATWVSAGASSLLESLATEVDQATSANDAQAWLEMHFATMARIATLFALPLLFAAALTAIVSRDAAVLIRAAFVHLPLALIGTGAAMGLVGIALAATDELCATVAGHTAPDAAALLRGLTASLTRAGPGVTGFGLVLVSLLIAFGGFFLTIELVVRAAAIWVAMLFLPLGLVGLIWPGTARWGRRLGELLAVLILSKFVIVAIVSMAVSATSAGVNSPNGPSLLGGAALLILAAVAPFTLLRMVPLIEAGAVAHLDGLSHRAVSLPPVVQQAVHQQALGRLLDGRGAAGGPPSGPAGPTSGSSTARAVATRGRDADGTQSGADKPVPAAAPSDATAWHSGVRVVDGGAAAPLGGATRLLVNPPTDESRGPGRGDHG